MLEMGTSKEVDTNTGALHNTTLTGADMQIIGAAVSVTSTAYTSASALIT